MILSAQSIRRCCPVDPFHERTVSHGKTFGLSAAGYDVRIREAVILRPGDFALASTLEHFHHDRTICWPAWLTSPHGRGRG
jgi:dCTP deaminase